MTEETSRNTPYSASNGSSPYATGGGGFVLEHVFGGTLLSSLILADSVPGLGDEYSLVEIAFQSRLSPVDDVVVTGEVQVEGPRNGSRRTFAIAVRRNPKVAPSSREFVELLADYLRTVNDHWNEIQAGTWRLGLAVNELRAGVRELSILANLAQTQPSAQSFHDAVLAPRRITAQVRRRLELVEGAIERAIASVGMRGASAGEAREMSWRLLSGLHIVPLDVQGNSSVGLTAVVNRLRSIATEAGEAHSLFAELCALAARYDSAGAVVDETVLRRDLSGVARLFRSPSYQRAWEVFGTLEGGLRTRTGRELVSRTADRRLALARDDMRKRLITEMRAANSSGVPLIVTGQPDVGKSAITLAAADALEAAGESVTAISLRDLPASPLDVIARLGAPLSVVFGALAVAPVRLLAVDGAEAVLEGRYDMLADIAAAARSSGIGLVVVTRSDARERVLEALASCANDPTSGPPVSFEIEGLTNDEAAQVMAAFPALGRLATEPRSAWLLKRLGLVDLLLRSNAIAALPDGALSEADVFAAVWSQLVRNGERNDPGRGSPDGREMALLNVARRRLIREAPVQFPGDAAALPSLRSDGLLLAPAATAAWERDEQFASDLIRDFAVARLLVREGWQLLSNAGAPRWAIRAARLACQAKLASVGSGVENARLELQSTFDALASEHGDRWADIPLESVLTLGDPYEALERAWNTLVSGEGDGIGRLLRLTLQRYTEGGIADPVLVRPVVQLLVNHSHQLAHLPWSVRDAAQDTEIRWLRGLAATGQRDTSDPLRARIRDLLLLDTPKRPDEYTLESLALLGPDLDTATQDLLRRVAAERPDFLAACVESFAAGLSMAVHHPEVLLELAEAYYVERPNFSHGFRQSVFDDGIRDHRLGLGLGAAMASWYYGPFWHLMRVHPERTLAFINRMLDQAARVRGGKLRDLEGGTYGTGSGHVDDASLPALELRLSGDSQQRYVGDYHAWSWYRGSTVGPYPCMSALMAVERYLDQAHRAGVSLQRLVSLALKDCRNLAMPSLIVGFLVRHIEHVAQELDPWLSEPLVWEMEFSRVTMEGILHVQGPDPDDLQGREQRRWSMREVAYTLAARALVTKNAQRTVGLRAIADELVSRAAARMSLSGPEKDMKLTTVRLWASALVSENYKVVETADGTRGVYYTPPEVSKGYARQMADMDRTQQIMRLLNKYGTDDRRRPADIDDLDSDLKVAIDLSANPPDMGQHFVNDAFAALAATALIAVGEGKLGVGEDALKWAATTVITHGLNPRQKVGLEDSLFSMGAERSAAIASPALLLPPFNENRPGWLDDEDRALVSEIMLRSLSSISTEVRRLAALGLEPVWRAACSLGTGAPGSCRHQIAFAAIEAAARHCRLGPFDPRLQRHPVLAIEGPAALAIDDIPTKDLLATHLAPLLVATCTCAASSCCVANDALTLRDELLRAYVRGYALRSRPGYSPHDEQDRRLVAHTLLTLAGVGDDRCLRLYLEALRNAPTALGKLLMDLVGTASYEEEQRPALWRAWPWIMELGLGTFTRAQASVRRGSAPERRDYELSVAALLPTPQLRMEDRDPDSTIVRARSNWVNVNILALSISRWVSLAAGCPDCVDSLVGLLYTTSPEFQATRGFDWVVQTVDGNFEEVASRTWHLMGWLEQVRDSGQLDRRRLDDFERLVDSLALHGSWRAVRLQKSLE